MTTTRRLGTALTLTFAIALGGAACASRPGGTADGSSRVPASNTPAARVPTSDHPSSAQEQRAVLAGVRLDFGLRHLPAGVFVSGTRRYTDFAAAPAVIVDLSDHRRPSRDVPPGPALQVQRMHTEPLSRGVFHANTTVGGRPARYIDGGDYRELIVRYPGRTELDISVSVGHVRDYSRGDLFAIARAARPIGDPRRISTWAPAAEVLPS